MKLLILLLFISVLILADDAKAWIFGPDSYEECVSDGKIGRSNSEMLALGRLCRKKFPVLPKLERLAKGKNGDIRCYAFRSPEIEFKMTIKGNKLFSEGLTLDIIERDTSRLTAVINNENHEITHKYTLYFFSGEAEIFEKKDVTEKKKHKTISDLKRQNPHFRTLSNEEIIYYSYQNVFSGGGVDFETFESVLLGNQPRKRFCYEVK